jgi:hypothetical protein
LAALFLCGSAEAGNAPGTTPTNVKVLANIIYKIPYWVDAGDFKSYPSTNTTVIITGSPACHYQVQWLSPNGQPVGYTGGNPSYENLSTQVLTSLTPGSVPGYPPLPIIYYGLGVPFVFSNMSNPATYGSANIRTDCAVGSKAVVAAFMATYNSAPTAGSGGNGAAPNSIVAIPISPVAGNDGD